VAQKAEEKQVPLISAPGTVPEIITALGNSMGRLKFNQAKKIPSLLEILHQNVKLEVLAQGLATGN
jgi:hypothetical protein